MKREKKKSPKPLTDAEIPRGSALNPHKSASVEWQAPEFEYQPKDVSWYWLSLMVAVILLALAIWQKNFLFAVFVIIAWLVVVYSTRRFPPVRNFKINEKGIEIILSKQAGANNKFYPYDEIWGFDIHAVSERYKELVLKLKSRFSPYIKINIPADNEEKIKSFLLKHISKEEYNDSLVDSFSKLIRF